MCRFHSANDICVISLLIVKVIFIIFITPTFCEQFHICYNFTHFCDVFWCFLMPFNIFKIRKRIHYCSDVCLVGFYVKFSLSDCMMITEKFYLWLNAISNELMTGEISKFLSINFAIYQLKLLLDLRYCYIFCYVWFI